MEKWRRIASDVYKLYASLWWFTLVFYGVLWPRRYKFQCEPTQSSISHLYGDIFYYQHFFWLSCAFFSPLSTTLLSPITRTNVSIVKRIAHTHAHPRTPIWMQCNFRKYLLIWNKLHIINNWKSQQHSNPVPFLFDMKFIRFSILRYRILFFLCGWNEGNLLLLFRFLLLWYTRCFVVIVDVVAFAKCSLCFVI